MKTVDELRKSLDTVSSLDEEDRVGLEFVLSFLERMDAQTKQLERIGDQIIKVKEEVQTLVRRR